MTVTAFIDLFEADRFAFLQQKYFVPMLRRLFAAGAIKVSSVVLDASPEMLAEPPRVKDGPEGQRTAEQVIAALKHLCMLDPTSNVTPDGVNLKQAGGYSEWVVKCFLKSKKSWSRFIEDGYKIKEDLEVFFRLKAKLPPEMRDINRIADEQALYQIIQPYKAQVKKTKLQAMAGVVTIYQDENVGVYIPTTEEASKALGTETRWCTASSTYGPTYFNEYSKQGPLFVIHIHFKAGVNVPGAQMEDMTLKYQLHFETGQFMDHNDEPVPLQRIFDTAPVVKEALQNYFTEQLKQVASAPAGTHDKELMKRWAHDLSMVGGHAMLAQLFDQRMIRHEHLEGMGLKTLLAFRMSGSITPEELQAYTRPMDRYSEAKFEEDGFYWLFYSLNDDRLLTLFSDGKGRRNGNNDQATAQKLFGDGAYDMFDHWESGSIDDHTARRWFMKLNDPKTWDIIREDMAVTDPHALGWSVDQMAIEIFDEQRFEDTLDKLKHGISRAHADAEESAWHKAYVGALENELGTFRWLDVDIPGLAAQYRAAFKDTYQHLLEMLTEVGEYNNLSRVLSEYYENRKIEVKTHNIYGADPKLPQVIDAIKMAFNY